ncbi:hypothetical protein CNBL2190 [Cryptococcus deneoformans B-3501A]|uniref:Complex 1 LYR protein domain-containing protein n=1 Tax=Cryptococcus deneoformans (strain JEC21 / ATCC MYA-565) TaxID=214684 RepID=Q5KCT6_CRYD1|nr:hypothetical protein CNH02190 [Cryptococcus neoformans var. neoformans JEC21]XP_772351.1 hypothetical protein CNBL2190 [Cryptococcus neoformans var. neoformans B-3501A]AAW45086.2 hypothetical protein CNH02190 [Cryptococcus neoformans var. neoformans JEC21]EAL17704.1 hypothetical protein CNBL2190 [Cryptococcus neoformans var. neoformans B-3501A]
MPIPLLRPLTGAVRQQARRGYTSVLEKPSQKPTQELPLRLQAIRLYKELHRLGRDYPDPEYDFNKRLRRAFEKNAKVTDPEAMKKQLELGEHIKKEVLALISLKKFRHLRRAYHPNEGPR